MQQLIDKIGLILGIALFLAIGLLYPKINLRKARRSRQVLFPFFALAYGITAYILLDKLIALVETLASLLKDKVAFLGSISLDWLVICLLNLLLLIGFFVVKGILCAIFGQGKQKQNTWLRALIRPFYEYDDGMKAWVLKTGRVQFRRYFTVFYVMAVVASALVLGIMYFAGKDTSLVTSFYPVLSLILLGEITFFLGGLTKIEILHDFSGEDDDAVANVNYFPMRDIYRQLFGERILHEDSKCISEENAASVTEVLDELLTSDDAGVAALGKYVVNRMKHGFRPDINYLNSSRDILLGKSILFSNPFHNDLSEYLFFPMNYLLMNRRKGLIILGRNAQEEDIARYAKEGLAAITNVPELWRVEILEEQEQDIDVGILPRCELYNQTLLEANQRFFDEVSYVIILEPSRLMSTFQIGLRLVVGRLGRGESSVIYCACDKNSDGLLDVLSHALKVSLSEVSATNALIGRSSYMCWSADGEFLHHRLFPNIAHYLGVGTELAVAAIKNQVSQVTWFSGRKFPVVDMRWIAGQYYQPLCQYMSIPLMQSAIDRYIRFCPSLWDATVKPNSFVVVEDEYCNLFEVLRQYNTRSTNQGFVNVISPNYLLREYMSQNAELFYRDAKAIPSLAPEYAHTRRNLALMVIMKLAAGRITEQEIEKYFIHFGLECAHGALKETELLLEEYFGVRNALRVLDFDELNKDGSGSYRKPYVVLNRHNRQLDGILAELENAYYVAEDKQERKHFLGSRLNGQLYQAFIPGQFHVFAGKYYEIYAITRKNGMLIRRAADHIEGRFYYRQLRSYSLENWRRTERVGNEHTVSDIRFETGYADVRCITRGYLRMEDFHDLQNAVRVEVAGIPERRYVQKAVMRITMPGASAAVRKTIAVLLNELFVTLYPDDWEYIAAVTGLPEGENCPAMQYEITSADEECIYIIEDSQIDIGLLASLERNMERCLEIIADYLSWHREMLLPPPVPEESEPLPAAPLPVAKKEKKKCFLMRFFAWLKRIFSRKKKGGQPPAGPMPAAGAETEAMQPPAAAEQTEPGIVRPVEAAMSPAETALAVTGSDASKEPPAESLEETDVQLEVTPEDLPEKTAAEDNTETAETKAAAEAISEEATAMPAPEAFTEEAEPRTEAIIETAVTESAAPEEVTEGTEKTALEEATNTETQFLEDPGMDVSSAESDEIAETPEADAADEAAETIAGAEADEPVHMPELSDEYEVVEGMAAKPDPEINAAADIQEPDGAMGTPSETQPETGEESGDTREPEQETTGIEDVPEEAEAVTDTPVPDAVAGDLVKTPEEVSVSLETKDAQEGIAEPDGGTVNAEDNADGSGELPDRVIEMRSKDDDIIIIPADEDIPAEETSSETNEEMQDHSDIALNAEIVTEAAETGARLVGAAQGTEPEAAAMNTDDASAATESLPDSVKASAGTERSAEEPAEDTDGSAMVQSVETQEAGPAVALEDAGASAELQITKAQDEPAEKADDTPMGIGLDAAPEPVAAEEVSPEEKQPAEGDSLPEADQTVLAQDADAAPVEEQPAAMGETMPEVSGEPVDDAGATMEQTAETGDVVTETDGQTMPAQNAAEALVHDAETSADSAGENVAQDGQLGEAAPLPESMDESAEQPSAQGEQPAEILTPYADSHYMLFGGGRDAHLLEPAETLEYLMRYGFHRNALQQAREKQKEAEQTARNYNPNQQDAHCCDFCGCELTGVEYETLGDGRERCNVCSRTAVKTLDGFIAIFNEALKNMGAFFQIRIDASIRIKFASAAKIARKLGYTLKKEAGFMPRAVGVAIHDRDGYTILIESGAPKLVAASTIAHELTHIWQYINWDEKEIHRTYDKKESLPVYEGMATWVEIQYLIFINELAYAKRKEICTMQRDDEYGEGFRRYIAEYPLLTGIFAPVSKTPFRSTDSHPLQ